jgi:predicted nucleic acid-binding protein
MILLDSTVVIDYSRGKDPTLPSLFSALPLVVCGIVRAEVLAGARHSKERAKLIGILDKLAPVSTPDSIWDTVGDNLARLLWKGLTVPLPDVTIATLGMMLDIEVWSRDRHFPAMQSVLTALKLYQERP